MGVRLKLARKLRKLSQSKLGASVGVSSQHIRKYERGVKRISARRLYECACALDVPVSFFFEQHSSPETGDIFSLAEDSLRLIEQCHAIDDQNVKRLVLRIMVVMAQKTG